MFFMLSLLVLKGVDFTSGNMSRTFCVGGQAKKYWGYGLRFRISPHNPLKPPTNPPQTNLFRCRCGGARGVGRVPENWNEISQPSWFPLREPQNRLIPNTRTSYLVVVCVCVFGGDPRLSQPTSDRVEWPKTIFFFTTMVQTQKVAKVQAFRRVKGHNIWWLVEETKLVEGCLGTFAHMFPGITTQIPRLGKAPLAFSRFQVVQLARTCCKPQTGSRLGCFLLPC